MACDFRLAAETAMLGLPEVKLGTMPAGGGTQRLPRLIGTMKAKEMIYLGQPIEASEAWRLGLVNSIAPAERLLDEAIKMATKLADRSSTALATIKSTINTGINLDLTSALEHESRSFATLFSSSDFREGVTAFLEKRRANFNKDRVS